MDLFVINRYRDSDEEVDIVNEENKRLEKLKQKIEERKKNTYKKSKELLDSKKNKQNFSGEIVTTNEKNNIFLKNEDLVPMSIDEPVPKTVDDSVTKSKPPAKEKNAHDFKVLGINDFEKRTKAPRVLPHWLANSKSVSTDLQSLDCLVQDLPWLHSTLKAKMLSEGLTHLFPVQKQVVPFIINEHKSPYPFQPHDICVSAPTGSGKTLAFVLPIIQILLDEIGCQVKALVVLPVQELAAQVAKVFKKYCTKTSLKVALLGGSTPLQQEQQNIVKYTESAGWVSEVDIIVCTAGRLVEHLQNTEGFSLKYLKFLVIDEADRIMDHIQNDWLYHVERKIKLGTELMSGKVLNLNWSNLNEQRPPPHKLLFSATLSQDPEKLDQWGLFQPKLFSAAPLNDFDDEDQIRQYATPAELSERMVTCEAENKPLVLYHFLTDQKWDKVLCFTNASESAHRLAVLLSAWGGDQFRVAELSAALDKPTREAVLRKFTQSEINVLIGTDALARGIDIPDCKYVVSYDPPRNIKTYIHRIGRTGRAGREGQAVTMLLPSQVQSFKELLQSGGKSDVPSIYILPEALNQQYNSYEYAMNKTKDIIQSEINSKVQKSVELKRRYKTKSRK